MIERKTVLEQPELHRSGLLKIQLASLMLEDGVEIDSKWIRTAIPLDADPQAQMNLVNEYLAGAEPSLPAVSQADIDFIKDCHALMVARFTIPE